MDASTGISKRYAKTRDHPNPVNDVSRQFVLYENQAKAYITLAKAHTIACTTTVESHT